MSEVIFSPLSAAFREIDRLKKQLKDANNSMCCIGDDYCCLGIICPVCEYREEYGVSDE